MNARKARAARRAEDASPVGPDGGRRVLRRPWVTGALVLAVAAVIAASFVLPGLFDEQPAPAARSGHGHSPQREGDGLAAGSPVPSFAERDVETGQPITSRSLYAGKTLLFFSEGVMCQACFQQIKGLEEMQAQLDRRGIRLVSITPDAPADLKQAIGQYGIESPLISDEDRDMSAAFDTLGRGMHADTPGHAFALIEQGRLLWYRDYWLPPDRTMYVEPAKVLADLAA